MMTNLALAGLLFAVSYARDVAPLMAFRCNRCHGDQGVAGKLDTRTWKGLWAAVAPGDPGKSPLIAYVEGRRGEPHRMPLGEEPLAADDISMLREWIAEGAAEDADSSPKYELKLDGIRLEPGKRVRVAARSPEKAYLQVELVNPRDGRVLHREAEAGIEGAWDLGAERKWPRVLQVRLTIAYAARRPEGATLCAGESRCVTLGTTSLPAHSR